MKNRTRPPKRSRTLLKTSRSNSACCSFSGSGTDLPSRFSSSTLRPTSKALLKIFSLAPPSACLHHHDPRVRLLEDARRGTHERRLHDAQVVDDLVDAAVDRGGEAARELRGEQHLAERVGHRQPQELEVALVEDVLRLDRRALVDPGLVQQPHALGPPGRAGGVDQRGELVGRDLLRRWSRWRWGGRRGRRRRARPGRPCVITLSPSAVPSKVTIFFSCGSSDRCSLIFAICSSFSAKTIWHSESLRMYAVSSPLVRRVDRGRRAGRTHHREVGEDPLVAGARGDADALLGLQTEREQAGREAGDPVAGLLPGDGLPGLAPRVAVRLASRATWPPGRGTGPRRSAEGCRRSCCRE